MVTRRGANALKKSGLHAKGDSREITCTPSASAQKTHHIAIHPQNGHWECWDTQGPGDGRDDLQDVCLNFALRISRHLTKLDGHRELKRREKQREKETKKAEKAAAAPAKPAGKPAAKPAEPSDEDLNPNVGVPRECVASGLDAMYLLTHTSTSNTMSSDHATFKSCERPCRPIRIRTSSR